MVDRRYERSLVLHAAVARKLRERPEILDRARAKVEEWIAQGGRSEHLLVQWREVLQRPLEEVACFLTERSERAAWMRKASPFTGVLEPRERDRILRAFHAGTEAV